MRPFYRFVMGYTITHGGRQRRSKGLIGERTHPIVTSAGLRLTQFFNPATGGPARFVFVDPDPELRVRHRRSCGRAMVCVSCVTSDPDGGIAAAMPAR